MIRAAGIMLTHGNRALFLRRADTGQWAFPGGEIEGRETAEEAAEREVREEIGTSGHSNPKLLMRRVKADGPEEVDYTTFTATTESETVPTLNAEHTGWCWADIAEPPTPLHPGAAAVLARLGADELGIARLMASGDLTSPQRYGSFWLWSIRITGTGYAYRDAHDEYCLRPADIYLNDEFLARCAGLPVVFIHPEKKPKLDSKEFHDRIVGTVFVPFLKGDEVWAVCRIYDDETIELLRSKEFSTSPGVVFDKNSGNITVKLKGGDALLLEGRPALLDHIALVPAGVWDKGGDPSGVDSTGVTMAEETEAERKAREEAERKDADTHKKLDAIMDSLSRAHARMDAIESGEKERKDAAEKEREDRAKKDAARKDRMDKHRKDRFGHRKDGETRMDWGKRHDADETAMCDAMRKDGAGEEDAREDARRARHDAEEHEAKEGGESFKKWAEEESKEPEHKEDKARKDAEEKEREDRARHDAATATEIADLKAKLASMQAHFQPVSAEDRNLIAQAQSRADGVAGLFGKRASPPIPGETPLEYRRRLAGEFKQHSEKFKAKSLAGFDADVLEMAEGIIYADAAAAARSPDRGGVGVLIPIREQDESGRTITKWTGDSLVWRQHFMSGAQVGRVRGPNEIRQFR